MKEGDLVQIKDSRFHKEIGVILWDSLRCLYVYWADGRVLWENKLDIKPVKKCP